MCLWPRFLAQPVDKLGGSRMCLVPAAESVQRQFTAVADGVRGSSRSVSIMWLNFTSGHYQCNHRVVVVDVH